MYFKAHLLATKQLVAHIPPFTDLVIYIHFEGQKIDVCRIKILFH